MNELITTAHNDQGEIIISGRELHEFLEVKTPYKQWFERMTEYGFEGSVDFIALTQKSVTAQGNSISFTDHHIKLDMAKEIAMLQRTEKGKQARQYFLQIEKMWNSPEMVMKRALEYADRKVIELKQKIETDKPKVIFADAVSASTTSILIGDLAKLLKQNGYDTGQKRLFEELREKGFLIKRKGAEYNSPTQRAMEMGLFEVKETAVTHSDGHVTISKTTKVTGKGQQYFINKFLKEELVTT
ncbi:phage antirepressor KilAC domain-containing protein [Cytobacillus firmus]|uniref:phage antirepressor KilAC domain-containing protein n=1 Tax=Cytobacillus firmus TaxID=1399 RepID=UPI00237B1FFE|nr:phage antirepressor KilAC domain-containing protein [Cytobacillus firmus]MDD9312690.1 phage antirepressor KilAC domain-containing protein [Cytobacillus firmus]